nr:MAG TPA: hypothetical protein [Caudoviricetes sp.]
MKKEYKPLKELVKEVYNSKVCLWSCKDCNWDTTKINDRCLCDIIYDMVNKEEN